MAKLLTTVSVIQYTIKLKSLLIKNQAHITKAKLPFLCKSYRRSVLLKTFLETKHYFAVLDTALTITTH